MTIIQILTETIQNQKKRGLSPKTIRLDGNTYHRFKHEVSFRDLPDVIIVNDRGTEYFSYMGHKLKLEHEFQDREFVINII